MNSQPSIGFEVPPTRPNRYAGQALAGFVGGLISLMPALLLLAALLGFRALAGISVGELALLIGGTFYLALIGLMLSVLGLRSPSRRWLAIVRVVLSAMVLVFIVLVVAYIFYALYVSCHNNMTTCSCF